MNEYRQFSDSYVGHEMSMDRRHAEAIGRFILSLNGHATVVEVGCCFGVSTAEVIDACERKDFSLTLIDRLFQEPVVRMFAHARGRMRLVMEQADSTAVLADYVRNSTVVILDGDHRLSHMQVESELIEGCRPRAVVLHDVTSTRSDCDGPRWFLHRWQAAGYHIAIDYLPRAGERTDRGLAILSSSQDDALAGLRSISLAAAEGGVSQ